MTVIKISFECFWHNAKQCFYHIGLFWLAIRKQPEQESNFHLAEARVYCGHMQDVYELLCASNEGRCVYLVRIKSILTKAQVYMVNIERRRDEVVVNQQTGVKITSVHPEIIQYR